MSCTKSRLVVASLLCLSIYGCASSGVGTPLPSGGLTKFLVYAPADKQLGLRIYDDGGNTVFHFARDGSYDNDPIRPSDTPAAYVAFTTVATLGDDTYHADLEVWSDTLGWQFGDEVDPFTANSLVLITND